MSISLDGTHWLGPEGPIARRMGKGYEIRSQQLEMVRRVQDTFAEGKVALVEAGTGTGKSFSYLLPSVIHAAGYEKKRRVIISTHTIALQEQLFEKDIPFLRAVLPFEASAVLVKGRGNYLSIRRLNRAMDKQKSLFEGEESQQLAMVEAWAHETEEGTYGSLPSIPLPQVWSEVQSDSDDCLGKKCPHFDDCFFQAARQRMQAADLLVVNHALFFSDLALRAEGAALLPDYDAVVLDEAHTLEQVAADHMGFRMSHSGVRYFLSRIIGRRGKGLLSGVMKEIGEQLFHTVSSAHLKASKAADQFFALVVDWYENDAPANGRIKTLGLFNAEQVCEVFDELCAALRRVENRLESLDDKVVFGKLSDRAKSTGNAVQQWVEQGFADSVYWVDVSPSSRQGRSRRVELHAAPIDVAPLLATRLFEREARDKSPMPIVMTSATLAVMGKADGFAYARERLGCKDATGLCLGSPFDYRKQAHLSIGKSIPEPSRGDKGNNLQQMADAIRKEIQASPGGVLVLATSMYVVRQLNDMLQPHSHSMAGPILAQGIHGAPRQLIAQFKAHGKAVLIGVDSFWQGIDIPGDALTSVIMTRLPFLVPSQPLVEARSERLQAQGKNFFRDYMLPEAVLKFKQGFGRLIRTRDDTGHLLVLDARVLTKYYGKQFIQALPEMLVEEI